MLLLLDNRNEKYYVGQNRSHILNRMANAGTFSISIASEPVSFGGVPQDEWVVRATARGARVSGLSYDKAWTLDEVMGEADKDIIAELCRYHDFTLFKTVDY